MGVDEDCGGGIHNLTKSVGSPYITQKSRNTSSFHSFQNVIQHLAPLCPKKRGVSLKTGFLGQQIRGITVIDSVFRHFQRQ